MSERPLLSIVITSYTTERLKDIFDLLDSIKIQTYPNIETILVTERSPELFDKVKSYVQEKSIPNSKVIFNNGELGASAAKNLGIKNAKGEIIGFVDDDTVLFPDWAEEMVKTYEDNSIIGVTGPIFPIWMDEPIKWLPSELGWIIGCSSWLELAEFSNVRACSGPNMSFRREALNLGGFFSTRLGPKRGDGKGEWDELSEEVEISLRIKRKTDKRIVFNPKVKVRHKIYKYKIALNFIVQRSYQTGRTRYMIRTVFRDTKEANALTTEYGLLKRIFTKLFPEIWRDFFKTPIIAWRKFSVTVISLSFVALGYYSHLTSPQGKI